MYEINTIIFDLGGVLVDWNPRYMYRKVFGKEDEMEAFLSEICTPEWNAEQDAGRTFGEATDLLVKQYPDYEAEIKMYFDRWPEMFDGVFEGSVSILEQLINDDQYKVYALTNWSAETWPIALDLFPFFKWFDGVLVSGMEKMKKPDPKIYEMILERFHIDRTKAVFFDDSPKNVIGAQKIGLHAFQFLNSEQLMVELNKFGINVKL